MKSTNKSMDYSYVSVWGRTLEEYTSMFNLQNFPDNASIISVADGPSTFNLEQRRRGIPIVSVDPIYRLSLAELDVEFSRSYEFNEKLFTNYPASFNFSGPPEWKRLLAKRRETFEAFRTDYKINPNAYIFGELPDLDTVEGRFDLCLCSNLLFIFDHLFDIEFHWRSLLRMLSLAVEVRIFPLYNIDGGPSDLLPLVLKRLTDKGYFWSIESNSYHVFKNGNRLLRILSHRP